LKVTLYTAKILGCGFSRQRAEAFAKVVRRRSGHAQFPYLDSLCVMKLRGRQVFAPVYGVGQKKDEARHNLMVLSTDAGRRPE
jgi:hypothetical protein